MDEAQVLLVDDDAALLQTEQSWFKAAGIRADIASSREEAIDRMRSSVYMVVVTDITLAGSGSGNLLTALKRYSPLTQVVVLAGAGSGAQAVDCLQGGASDVFFKTDNLQPLIASVKGALDRAERWLNLLDCEEHGDDSVLGSEVHPAPNIAAPQIDFNTCDTVLM